MVSDFLLFRDELKEMAKASKGNSPLLLAMLIEGTKLHLLKGIAIRIQKRNIKI